MAPTTKVLLICNKCVKNINNRQKHLICEGECRKAWHIPQCSSVTQERYAEIVNDPDIPWFCDQCTKKRMQRRSMLPDASIQHTPGGLLTSTSTTPTTLANADNEISLGLIYKEIQSLKNQAINHQNTICELRTIITDYKATMDMLIKENTDLRNDNEILHDKFRQLEYTRDNLEQKNLNHNVIINGVTEVQNEDVKQIVCQIAATLEVNIEATDLVTAMRKPSNTEITDHPRSIMITFKNKEKRDEILLKKSKKLSTRILNVRNEDERPIYITEQLTARKQYISKMARDVKRAGIVQFAWVKNGDIFIRKTEESRIIKIKHIEQLQQLLNAPI